MHRMELLSPVEAHARQGLFAAHRLLRAAQAHVMTAVAAIHRFRHRPHRRWSDCVASNHMPPLAKAILLAPVLLFPLLLYLLTSLFVASHPDHVLSALSVRIPAAYSPAADAAASLPPGFVPAPRPTRQVAVGGVATVATQDPMIRLVLSCEVASPCCLESYPHAVRSLLAQSLHPSTLTVVHACTDPQQRLTLESGIRHLVADILTDTVYNDNIMRSDTFLRFAPCRLPPNATIDMEHCLLRHLARPDNPVKKNSYVLAANAAMVFEPTALEKLWMYTFIRPHVSATRPLPYDPASLRAAALTADPMNVNVSYPPNDPNTRNPVSVLPIFYVQGTYNVLRITQNSPDDDHASDASHDIRPYWHALAAIMSSARVLRQALYTQLKFSSSLNPAASDINVGKQKEPMLSLHTSIFHDDDLPAHLWSDHSFYKWSAHHEEDEIYANPLDTEHAQNGYDSWPMPSRKIKRDDESKPNVFFLMPWIQMGGSEKCILDIADRMVNLGWPVSFILTMPFWDEDDVGEMGLKHEWLDKAYAVTSDVFDIVQLAPNDKFTKTLRYLVETRSPDYVFTGNSRVIYEHSKFIKALSPKTVIADYNHMVHMDWEVVPGKGGGMPRYGTTFTDHIDLHLTASDNVTNSMKTWIDPDTLAAHPEKVKTCYIGADPEALHNDETKAIVRTQMRGDLDIAEDSIVVLFAGRFVRDKGIDVMGEVLTRVASDSSMASTITFVFVGSGEQKDMLTTTQKSLQGTALKILIEPPAVGIAELRNYYAMADIFLLPSTNEGIALVLYEAMSAGMLVMSTDVGGQKELIRSDTGILLPDLNNAAASASFIMRQLQAITRFTPMFTEIQMKGTREVRQKFTTERFCDCVIDNMVRTRESLLKTKPEVDMQEVDGLRLEMADVMRSERIHGEWNRKQKERSMAGQVTIGIKTYVCDASIVRQVVGLVRSIRVNYPRVRVLLANDGPTRLGDASIIRNDPHTEEIMLPADSGISIGRNIMVNMTTTKYFVLLDDDHVFDEDTDLRIATNGIGKENFDVVGIRVRNLPGIEELERISIFIPRYVAKVSKFENREVTLCVWNENNGPGVQSMRVPIRVDVLHNALIAKTGVLREHAWRNVLKVNEHMTFFLDARRAGVKVGYLPSVFVHHRARRYSACYKTVRFREEKYEQLLDYKDEYEWDVACGDNFPEAVREHLEVTRDA